MEDGGSEESSPGSRFKVDVSEAGGGKDQSPSTSSPLPPLPLPPPPPPAIEVNGDGKDLPATLEPSEASHSTLLTPSSKEGELGVPVIELPDGEGKPGGGDGTSIVRYKSCDIKQFRPMIVVTPLAEVTLGHSILSASFSPVLTSGTNPCVYLVLPSRIACLGRTVKVLR